MEISAKVVKELRERTGAGMMDCKRALQEMDGDMDKDKLPPDLWEYYSQIFNNLQSGF